MYLVGTLVVLSAIVGIVGSVLFAFAAVYVTVQEITKALIGAAGSLAAKAIRSDFLPHQQERLIAHAAAFPGSVSSLGHGLSDLARKGSIAVPHLLAVPSAGADPQHTRP